MRERGRERGRKCRNWIARRESLGAANCLFCELSSEDPQEHRKHTGISVEKFDELLRLVECYISKTDTVKNGKESRKHLKPSGISSTVAELLTGSNAK